MKKTVLMSAMFLLVFLPGCSYESEIKVVITNTGTTVMRSTELHVTGKNYKIGNIAPKQSAEIFVCPTSESHITISYADSGSSRKKLTADCYFEQKHYTGSIQIEIDNGIIKKIQNNIRITGW
ncbi:MAG: hypothetical protein GY795_22885 [Desulfobacterales bacterium]|nr:hypothetical protein [Desulfobacterales bacterium]